MFPRRGTLFLAACDLFLFRSYWAKSRVNAMDAEKEREIIRLWNQLRLLERQGRPAIAVRRQIERALAERERDAA